MTESIPAGRGWLDGGLLWLVRCRGLPGIKVLLQLVHGHRYRQQVLVKSVVTAREHRAVNRCWRKVW